MSEISFNKVKHEYICNGIKIPSVTQVLSTVGLPDLTGIPAATLKDAAERGTAVHAATEYDDQNDLDYDSLDDRIIPYLEAYRQFKAESGFEVQEIEKRIFDPALGYAGTLDRFGILRGKPAILDIKTGAFYPLSVGPQTAAYESALRKETRYGSKPYNRYALQLKDDGTYKLHKLTNDNDFNIFLSALNIYKWRNQ